MPQFKILLASALLAVVGFGTSARAELRLVMFEQDGCHYCIQWHREIGPIYPKTPEGRAAPLQTVHLRENWSDEISLSRGRPLFTPTFVLVRDGKEIDRLEGYPGEDFFWGLVARMMQDEPEWISESTTGNGTTGG